MKYLLLVLAFLTADMAMAADCTEAQRISLHAATAHRDKLANGYGFCTPDTCMEGYEKVGAKCLLPAVTSWLTKDQSVTEAETKITVRGKLDRAASSERILSLSTSSSSAQSSLDFNLSSNSMRFAAGSTTSDPIIVSIHRRSGYQPPRAVDIAIDEPGVHLQIAIVDSEPENQLSCALSETSGEEGQALTLHGTCNQPLSKLFPTNFAILIGTQRVKVTVPKGSSSFEFSVSALTAGDYSVQTSINSQSLSLGNLNIAAAGGGGGEEEGEIVLGSLNSSMGKVPGSSNYLLALDFGTLDMNSEQPSSVELYDNGCANPSPSHLLITHEANWGSFKGRYYRLTNSRIIVPRDVTNGTIGVIAKTSSVASACTEVTPQRVKIVKLNQVSWSAGQGDHAVFLHINESNDMGYSTGTSQFNSTYGNVGDGVAGSITGEDLTASGADNYLVSILDASNPGITRACAFLDNDDYQTLTVTRNGQPLPFASNDGPRVCYDLGVLDENGTSVEIVFP